MRVWIVEGTEPVPLVDQDYRELRSSILCRLLAQRGHEVSWFTSSFDHMKKQQRRLERDTVWTDDMVRIRFLSAPGYSSNLSPARIWHSRSLARRFRCVADDEPHRPDVVFAAWPIPELAERAVLFCREEGVPVVVDVRDLWPDIYLTVLPGPLRPLGRLILTQEFQRCRRVFGWASGITAISQRYLDWGRQKGFTWSKHERWGVPPRLP